MTKIVDDRCYHNHHHYHEHLNILVFSVLRIKTVFSTFLSDVPGILWVVSSLMDFQKNYCTHFEYSPCALHVSSISFFLIWSSQILIKVQLKNLLIMHFLRPPVTLSHLDVNILSALFSHTLSVLIPETSDQLLEPHLRQVNLSVGRDFRLWRRWGCGFCFSGQ